MPISTRPEGYTALKLLRKSLPGLLPLGGAPQPPWVNEQYWFVFTEVELVMVTSGGQVMTGGVVSRTVRSWLFVTALPHVSVAFHLRVMV